MNEKYIGKISLEFNTVTDAENIYVALYPETIKVPSHRSRYELYIQDKRVVIAIYSKDITSFRAAVNTMLRLLQTIEPLIKRSYEMKTL